MSVIGVIANVSNIRRVVDQIPRRWLVFCLAASWSRIRQRMICLAITLLFRFVSLRCSAVFIYAGGLLLFAVNTSGRCGVTPSDGRDWPSPPPPPPSSSLTAAVGFQAALTVRVTEHWTLGAPSGLQIKWTKRRSDQQLDKVFDRTEQERTEWGKVWRTKSYFLMQVHFRVSRCSVPADCERLTDVAELPLRRLLKEEAGGIACTQ
jgi:hypothetical protein